VTARGAIEDHDVELAMEAALDIGEHHELLEPRRAVDELVVERMGEQLQGEQTDRHPRLHLAIDQEARPQALEHEAGRDREPLAAARCHAEPFVQVLARIDPEQQR